MIELLSYWKTTCSPQIVIEAGYLDSFQLSWWKDLLLKGMREFFYRNNIDFLATDFLLLSSTGKEKTAPIYSLSSKSLKTLVPIGGGKDSAVTLELLKEFGVSTCCFLLNPTKAANEVSAISGPQELAIVRRQLDPLLLELNKEGFLNGHTPFSALLAFLSVCVAAAMDCSWIALSNEQSSNEANVEHLGEKVNHQYSKSVEFEQSFREYCSRYLAQNIEYFSLLRPIYELQISKLFAKMPKYHSHFLSCNRGYKSNHWCGRCPKCLFVFAALSAFMPPQAVIKIFRKNVFSDPSLLPLAQALLGYSEAKPFECVGTFKETKLAFILAREQIISAGEEVPILLSQALETLDCSETKDLVVRILNHWNHAHFIPQGLTEWMEAHLKEVLSLCP